jgi:hypothetical protein
VADACLGQPVQHEPGQVEAAAAGVVVEAA